MDALIRREWAMAVAIMALCLLYALAHPTTALYVR